MVVLLIRRIAERRTKKKMVKNSSNSMAGSACLVYAQATSDGEAALLVVSSGWVLFHKQTREKKKPIAKKWFKVIGKCLVLFWCAVIVDVSLHRLPFFFFSVIEHQLLLMLSVSFEFLFAFLSFHTYLRYLVYIFHDRFCHILLMRINKKEEWKMRFFLCLAPNEVWAFFIAHT